MTRKEKKKKTNREKSNRFTALSFDHESRFQAVSCRVEKSPLSASVVA